MIFEKKNKVANADSTRCSEGREDYFSESFDIVFWFAKCGQILLQRGIKYAGAITRN